MFNLTFKSKPPKKCCSGFKNYVEKTDKNGNSCLVECADPYEGLSAESFSLQAQIDAGVPLEHLSPISTGSLFEVDQNNKGAESFVFNLKNQKSK